VVLIGTLLCNDRFDKGAKVLAVAPPFRFNEVDEQVRTGHYCEPTCISGLYNCGSM
jgi:hypothetical protein